MGQCKLVLLVVCVRQVNRSRRASELGPACYYRSWSRQTSGELRLNSGFPKSGDSGYERVTHASETLGEFRYG